MIFTDFFIEDHHKDTLIYVKSLESSLIYFKGLYTGNIELNYLNGNEFYLKLKHYEGEKTHSLNILLDKLKKNKKRNRKIKFKVGKVDLDGITFLMENENNRRSKPVKLNSGKIKASDLIFIKNQLKVNIENFEGILDNSFMKSINTSALLSYKPGFLSVNKLRLSSGPNYLNGKIELSGTNGNLNNFKSNGNINVIVDNCKVDLISIFPKNEYFNDIPPFKTSFSANGSLSELELQDLKVSNPFLKFFANLNVKNLFKAEGLKIKMFTDSLNINLDELRKIISLPRQVKKNFLKISNLNLKGTGTFSLNDFDFDLFSKNKWADFSTKGKLGLGILNKNKRNKSFKVHGRIKNFKLSHLINENQKIKLSTEYSLNGNFKNLNTPNLYWKLNNMTLENKNIIVDKINLNGRIEELELRNNLNIDSNLLTLKSDFLADLNQKKTKITLLANIDKIDFKTFGLKSRSKKLEFGGVILLNSIGNNLDDLKGNLKISSASIKNEFETIDFNPIVVKKGFTDKKTFVEIQNTDFIEGELRGEFLLSKIASLFQNTFHQVYPFVPYKKIYVNQSASLRLNIKKKILKALYPNSSIPQNIIIEGLIDSKNNFGKLIIDAPLFEYNEIKFNQIHFEANTKSPDHNSLLSVKNISNKYFKLNNFKLTSKKIFDSLYFKSEFEANDGNGSYQINIYHTQDEFKNSHFAIKKSTIPLGQNDWVVNPKNLNTQSLSYYPKNNKIELSKLTAYSGDQFISLLGSFNNLNDYNLELNLQNTMLRNIIPPLTSFEMDGLTKINASIIRNINQNEIEIDGNITDLVINNQPLGNLYFKTDKGNQKSVFLTDIKLYDRDKKTLDINGFWGGSTSSNFKLGIDIKNLNISFLSPLGKKAINNFKGFVDGRLNLSGNLKKFVHDGFLELKGGEFFIPFLNLEYSVEDTTVDLKEQNFVFKKTAINDLSKGTSAIFSGNLSHNNFSNWTTDLTITSERMLLLNTENKLESLFFGEGYLNGKVNLNGPTKNLKISLDGSTEKGTSIKIPLSEDLGVSNFSFVDFIDKNEKKNLDTKNRTKRIEEVKGLELDFELDINNLANIEIVIDQETGSSLSGNGSGNLLMEINTNGKFNMWGDFITDTGVYNFRNLGLIDKKFNLKPGGNIIWEGDPLEARMNIQAVYEVPGGANPAFLLDNPSFNKNIPTDVIIKLQGNLLKPDNPIFEIEFPNTSGTLASEINYRLADPQRSQLQAISLLSQGIFINEVSVSMQGITNNLYQKASDIVANLIGEKDNDKLKVGIDYLQGDKSALIDIATEDRLGFTLSTKISEKILLNGKIGVPVGGLEQTLIVGNVQIDFILNEEGSLKAKIFNKENEFRYIGDEFGYTQGLGLSYDVDFNTFKQLINKIRSQSNYSKNENEVKQDNPSEFINFIKKN